MKSFAINHDNQIFWKEWFSNSLISNHHICFDFKFFQKFWCKQFKKCWHELTDPVNVSCKIWVTRFNPKKAKIQLKHHHNHQRQQGNEYSCHSKIDVTIICHFKIFNHNTNVPSSSSNIFLQIVLFSLCLVNIQIHSAAFNIYILDWILIFSEKNNKHCQKYKFLKMCILLNLSLYYSGKVVHRHTVIHLVCNI